MEKNDYFSSGWISCQDGLGVYKLENYDEIYAYINAPFYQIHGYKNEWEDDHVVLFDFETEEAVKSKMYEIAMKVGAIK